MKSTIFCCESWKILINDLNDSHAISFFKSLKFHEYSFCNYFKCHSVFIFCLFGDWNVMKVMFLHLSYVLFVLQISVDYWNDRYIIFFNMSLKKLKNSLFIAFECYASERKNVYFAFDRFHGICHRTIFYAL